MPTSSLLFLGNEPFSSVLPAIIMALVITFTPALLFVRRLPSSSIEVMLITSPLIDTDVFVDFFLKLSALTFDNLSFCALK